MRATEVHVRVQDGDEFAALLAAVGEWRMVRLDDDRNPLDEQAAAARIDVAHDDLLRAYSTPDQESR